MKTVLVIEDNLDLASILRRRFTDGGFKVDVLNDGFALLARLGNKTIPGPDVVILDIRLPGRSGHELLDRVKTVWAKTKVFVFSAHAEYRIMVRRDMVEGFFLKTDGVENLVDTVSRSVTSVSDTTGTESGKDAKSG
jgi:DNA-binding response OmpR family regulator